MEVKAKTNLEKHLTANKFYRVIERTDKEFTIMNDSNIKYSYPRKAFEATAESQTKIVNPNTTVSDMPGSNAMWVASGTTLNEEYKKWLSTVSDPSFVLKVVHRKEDEIDVTPTTNRVDDTINNGGSTDYYKINPEWKDLADIIEEKEMSFNIANIFKSCYRLGGKHHSSKERDLNKIIYFANRELNLYLRGKKEKNTQEDRSPL